jgi:hypothetical protein
MGAMFVYLVSVEEAFEKDFEIVSLVVLCLIPEQEGLEMLEQMCEMNREVLRCSLFI